MLLRLFYICKFAVHKFLKPNMCFVLQLESDVRDSFISPNQSRTSRFYCILFTKAITRLLYYIVEEEWRWKIMGEEDDVEKLGEEEKNSTREYGKIGEE
jgi:hypothetical protein